MLSSSQLFCSEMDGLWAVPELNAQPLVLLVFVYRFGWRRVCKLHANDLRQVRPYHVSSKMCSLMLAGGLTSYHSALVMKLTDFMERSVALILEPIIKRFRVDCTKAVAGLGLDIHAK